MNTEELSAHLDTLQNTMITYAETAFNLAIQYRRYASALYEKLRDDKDGFTDQDAANVKEYTDAADDFHNTDQRLRSNINIIFALQMELWNDQYGNTHTGLNEATTRIKQIAGSMQDDIATAENIITIGTELEGLVTDIIKIFH